jgi:ketosteroid isomerase-like protein
MESAKVALVRQAYERFNAGDVSGVVDCLDPDVRYPDVIKGTTLYGKEAVRDHLERQVQDADRTALPLEVLEIGDAVLVVAYHQAYEKHGGPVGPGISAVQRLTFRGERIANVQFTPIDEIPEVSRERFGGS